MNCERGAVYNEKNERRREIQTGGRREKDAIYNIDQHNYRQACCLSVTPKQSGYLSSAPMILARAYAYRHKNSEVSLIEEGTDKLGLVMTRETDLGTTVILDQFFIDQRFQGRGYGRKAMELLLQSLRERRLKRVVLCYREADQAAARLYRSLGFTETGERDDDEILMELIL